MLNSQAGNSDWGGVPGLRVSLAFPSCAAVIGIALVGCSPGSDSGERVAGDPSAAEILGVMAARFVKDREASQRAAEPENETNTAPAAPNPPEPETTSAPPQQPIALATPIANEGSCEIPYRGLVTIIPVRSRNALRRAAADPTPSVLVYSTEDTAIFDDGRVLTADVENVGEDLSAVGWAANQMRILGTTAGAAAASYTRSGRGSTKRRSRG